MKSRNTCQKEIISKVANNQSGFFTTEELYEKVKLENDKIGIATIYRNLKELEKQGIVHNFMCENRKVYSSQKRSHCHFKCEKCGKSEHFEVKNLDFLKFIKTGETCHFNLEVVGICNECKNTSNLKNSL